MVPKVTARVGGLLFADDVCALAPSRKRLQAALRKIEGWAAQWKMAVGVRKCGIMVFFGKQRKLEEQAWQISGEDLPVVDSYKYLGVTLVGSLDLGTVVDERVGCAEKAFHLMAPFLGSATVPVAARLLVFKAAVLSVLTYGAELLACNRRVYFGLCNALRSVV